MVSRTITNERSYQAGTYRLARLIGMTAMSLREPENGKRIWIVDDDDMGYGFDSWKEAYQFLLEDREYRND